MPSRLARLVLFFLTPAREHAREAGFEAWCLAALPAASHRRAEGAAAANTPHPGPAQPPPTSAPRRRVRMPAAKATELSTLRGCTGGACCSSCAAPAGLMPAPSMAATVCTQSLLRNAWSSKPEDVVYSSPASCSTCWAATSSRCWRAAWRAAAGSWLLPPLECAAAAAVAVGGGRGGARLPTAAAACVRRGWHTAATLASLAGLRAAVLARWSEAMAKPRQALGSARSGGLQRGTRGARGEQAT